MVEFMGHDAEIERVALYTSYVYFGDHAEGNAIHYEWHRIRVFPAQRWSIGTERVCSGHHEQDAEFIRAQVSSEWVSIRLEIEIGRCLPDTLSPRFDMTVDPAVTIGIVNIRRAKVMASRFIGRIPS